VKFTIETVINEKLSAFSLIPTVAQVTTSGPLTVRVTTSSPDPILEKRIATLPIVPKATYSQTGTAKFSQQPVGTGRYRVTKWDPADGLYIEANPNSWAGAPETPKWVVRYMPNVQAQVNALEAGEIDILGLGSGTDYVTQLADKFNVRSVATGSFRTLRLDTTKAPFGDVRVRRAMQSAVDVQALLNSVDKGFGIQGSGQPFLQNCFGFNPKLTATPFDLNKAKSLLAEAGYQNGFQTGISSINIFHPLLAALSGMFAKVGVTATVVDLDGAGFVKETYGLSTEGMFMSPWSYQPLYDAEQVYRFATVAPQNWVDSKWDDMLQQERTTVNADKRLSILQDMAAYMQDQVPWILLDAGAFAWSWAKNVNLDPYTGQWFLYHKPYKTI
jgi:peptide/nickel transport system substrate-binding protein